MVLPLRHAQQRKRVLVAMSGGVDSSVAAAMLVSRGYAVAGGYMKNFSPESWSGVLEPDCPWEQDLRDVTAVCNRLGIERFCFNFEDAYRQRVIEYLFAEYAAGRTPNPDIRCNRDIKFDLFLERAKGLGFSLIATGHYARVKRGRLFQGVDGRKDQSYFLYCLTPYQLRRVLFPLGRYRKTEVRNLARRFGLPNADKPDSQGICFVGHVKLPVFLAQRIKPQHGPIVDPRGDVIGQHPGAWYFTVGQRQGLGLGGGTPWYVVKKDVIKNRLVVAPGRNHPRLYRRSFPVRQVHWIRRPRGWPLVCEVKIRYRQASQPAVLLQRGSRWVVRTRNPQFAIAPGQAAVFHQGSEVLGGATIASW